MAEAGYPKSIFFLIGNEFCERFSYYGLRAILSLYITEVLLYTEREATIIYHVFAMTVYVLPLLGAIISDSWLGKYNTILYISVVYAFGNVILAMSAVKPLKLPEKEVAMLGLALIGIGTGGIKPCVAAFGGDQFVLPQQQHQLEGYFHWFYFSINAGSFLSMFITPVLRKHVHCFGELSCYSLAFFVPAVLMILAVVLFRIGKPLYKMQPPAGNMVLKVAACIGTALKLKMKSKGVKKDHWLDYAVEKYGVQLISDIKVVLSLLVVYIPIPLFWALFEQQATAWTFQARQLNGEIGKHFTILPDQMQVVNPTLILILIPFFNYVVYPFFNKLNVLNTPLQRMAVGGILAGIAYVIAAFLSLGIEENMPYDPPKSICDFRVVAILNCHSSFTSSLIENNSPVNMPPMSVYRSELTGFDVHNLPTLGFQPASCCSINEKLRDIVGGKTSSCYYHAKTGSATCIFEDIEKSLNGDPIVRTIVNKGDLSGDINIRFYGLLGLAKEFSSSNISAFQISPGNYKVQFDESEKYPIRLSVGGVYTLGVAANSKDDYALKLFEITPPNQIHILCQIPQYIAISAAEVMISVTGIEFAYQEAPVSMKSVVQAMWLLTVGVGQLFVIVIELLKIYERQFYVYMMYAFMMFADMLLFIIISMFYQYRKEGG